MNATKIYMMHLQGGQVALPERQSYLLSLSHHSFYTGCFLTVQSTVLVDLVGVERLPKAQGTLFMILGVGSLIGTPAAGEVHDALEYILTV